MKKYIYVVGLIYAFIMFMIGFNHYEENGLNIFGVGFMTSTPIISFVIATIWLKKKSEEEEEREVEI